MWAWLAGLAWALPSVDTAVPTDSAHPGDAAVVVGIEDYFLLPDVPHAARDAAAVEQFLVRTRGVPADRVRTLGRGANREQILDAIDTLGAATAPGGTLWVYFAGHGAADPDTGVRMLLGADAQADAVSFSARAVPLPELETRAVQGGGRAVVILDTCYSGRARGGADLVEGKRFAVPAYATGPQERVTRWSAAGPTEWSGVLPAAEHGAFTYAVLGALRGWADGATGPADGQVTADEAQAWVVRALAELQVVDQRPMLEGPTDAVLSTAREPAPALDAPEADAVLGTLLAPVAPTVARVTPGPGVDLSPARYRQLYRPRTPSLLTGLVVAGVGGAMAAGSWASFRFGANPTEAEFQVQQALNVAGGSVFLTGAGLAAIGLLPSRRAPIVVDDREGP